MADGDAAGAGDGAAVAGTISAGTVADDMPLVEGPTQEGPHRKLVAIRLQAFRGGQVYGQPFLLREVELEDWRNMPERLG